MDPFARGRNLWRRTTRGKGKDSGLLRCEGKKRETAAAVGPKEKRGSCRSPGCRVEEKWEERRVVLVCSASEERKDRRDRRLDGRGRGGGKSMLFSAGKGEEGRHF